MNEAQEFAELPEITVEQLSTMAEEFADQRIQHHGGQASLSYYGSEANFRRALTESFCRFAAARYLIVPTPAPNSLGAHAAAPLGL